MFQPVAIKAPISLICLRTPFSSRQLLRAAVTSQFTFCYGCRECRETITGLDKICMVGSMPGSGGAVQKMVYLFEKPVGFKVFQARGESGVLLKRKARVF
jgi:hypothetical protein